MSFKNFLLALMFFCSITTFAEEISPSKISTALKSDFPKTMSVSGNLLALPFGIIDGEFSFAIKEKLSLIATADAGYIFLVAAFNSRPAWGTGLGVGLNWQINNTNFHNSWYVKTVARLIYSGIVENTNHLALVPSMEVGHSWFFNNGFLISLGLAAHLPIALGALTEGGHLILPFPVPMINFRLGYAW